ncbi:MAG: T9SS type A sorting domain-containing protein [Bacteroidales bacterium]|nr:T9SS type A sorting domain-containing protein [Bacteroidales bacterium]
MATDNCDGEVAVTCNAGAITGDDCNKSQIFTYSAVDASGNSASATVTYTWTIDTEAPVFSNCPTSTIDLGYMPAMLPDETMAINDAGMATDNCGVPMVSATGGEITGDDCNKQQIWTVTAVDGCGHSAICYVIYTWSVECGETYGYCTYTQGFFGNLGGLTCDGMTALDLMKAAFWDGSSYMESVNFGAGGRVFELFYTDITSGNIFKMLPGGGKDATLRGYATFAEISTWRNVPISIKKATFGKIDNTLLAQTIVLWFNMQNDLALGSLTITDEVIITADAAGCGSDEPMPGTEMYTALSPAVLDYFGGAFTVEQLFSLANQMLGGEIDIKEISPSSISMTIDAINNAFDECRVLVGFTDVIPPDLGIVSLTKMNTSIELIVYPNPFSTYATFEMKALEDTKVRVDIYNNAGSLITVICDEVMQSGDVRSVILDGSKYMQGEYIYRVSTNTGFVSGTIVKAR